MFSFDTNVVAILNTKNAIPPITSGLNLINSPDVVVAIPAINNIMGGGAIFQFNTDKSCNKKGKRTYSPKLFDISV